MANTLRHHPWATEVVMDRGKEFAAEVRETLKHECGTSRKIVTTRNPQANSVTERAHQVTHNVTKQGQSTSEMLKILDTADGQGFCPPSNKP